MHIGLSELNVQRGDLELARHHLTRSEELGDALGLPQHPYRWRVATAHLHQAEGQLDAAVELLQEAERRYNSDFSPQVRPVAAMTARVWVEQGKLDAAEDWASVHGLTADDEPSYLREFEHITLARVLLARRQLPAATDLLQRLLRAADEGGRAGSALEILVLQVLALQAQGHASAALVPLRSALALGEAENNVRPFIEAGADMTELLHAADRQGIARAYVRRLLVTARTATAPVQQDLIDPLSERELDVLRLLGSDLSGPEIAMELVVSLHTVRSHTKSIYAKLGVNSRRHAVREAEALHLLPKQR